jgi:PAS domain S-box-containing protein
VQDITERKTAEEKIRNSRNFLETILNSMGDAISIVDVETFAIVGTNRVFLERCGLSESEVLGKKCYDLSSHDCDVHTLTPETCPVLRTIGSGESATGEHVHHDSAGNRVFVEVKTSPLKNSGGILTHVVHVARDISERKRAEMELQLFAEKLELSNRELTDFAYVASHDLQEPLRKVTAFGDRLRSKYQDVLGEQGLDYLERMRHAAVRMQTLIEDLLSFSRVSTKAQPFSPVEMSEITGEVLDDLEIRIQELQGIIEVGNLPAIEADPLQMRQIMQNLLGNALKFHRPGVAPLIRVQGELVDGGKNCRITVADNGIGFEEKYLERIFGVFQRLHGRNEYAGSGVGLAICRKITDRHHGSVTAMSTAGEGATFILTLPVSQKEKRSAL